MSKEFMNEATLKRLIEKIKSEFSKYLKRDGLSVTAEQGEEISVTQSDTTKGVELNFTIPKGEKGDPGEQGPAGEKGESGYTPQKGVDYFTPEDIADLNIPVVDDFMSETSENAIANKVITQFGRILSEDVQGANLQLSRIGADVAGIQQQINQHAHFKGYFSTNAKIQATEATPNDFAYSAESGTKWVYDEVEGWQDTGTPVPDQMTPASDTTPLVDGEAAVGTENAYARGDHRHPSDPTKASVADLNALKADMESVLDELHAYAQALVNGGEA